MKTSSVFLACYRPNQQEDQGCHHNFRAGFATARLRRFRDERNESRGVSFFFFRVGALGLYTDKFLASFCWTAVGLIFGRAWNEKVQGLALDAVQGLRL